MNDCIFCKIVKGDAASWTVYEDESVKAFLDINPVNIGHTLIIPKKHYKDLFDTPKEELMHMMKAAKKVSYALKKALRVTSLNLYLASGEDAGQEIHHIHLHIIPRFPGDNIKIHYRPKPELRQKFDEIQLKIRSMINL
jgi:histidine triad (HIT) family protein